MAGRGGAQIQGPGGLWRSPAGPWEVETISVALPCRNGEGAEALLHLPSTSSSPSTSWEFGS